MENTPRLNNTLFAVLSQHRNWLDLRHLKTLAWMMVGLLQSHTLGLFEQAGVFDLAGYITGDGLGHKDLVRSVNQINPVRNYRQKTDGFSSHHQRHEHGAPDLLPGNVLA